MLFLTVAKVPRRGPLYYDQAVFFCPFCGASLQTKDEVAEKLKGKAE